MRNPFLLLVLILLSSSKCRNDERCDGDSHNGLVIDNHSTRRINYGIYWNYPDTAIPDAHSPLYYAFQAIEPGGSVTRGAGPHSCWEAVMADLPGQKEWVYFFDQDSLEQLPWDTIRLTGRGILERRLISPDLLAQNDFHVTFP